MKIGCVIMAAGNGSRFGENKLAVEFQGKSLIQRTLESIPQAQFAQVVVVTQHDNVAKLADQFDFAVIENQRPEWGISHTIALGTEYLENCDGILYLVSDQPMLEEDTITRVVEKWCRHPKSIVGASHNGRRGNPCIFPKNFFTELKSLEGDCGGNVIIQANMDKLKLVEVSPQQLVDIDTPEQLANF